MWPCCMVTWSLVCYNCLALQDNKKRQCHCDTNMSTDKPDHNTAYGLSGAYFPVACCHHSHTHQHLHTQKHFIPTAEHWHQRKHWHISQNFWRIGINASIGAPNFESGQGRKRKKKTTQKLLPRNAKKAGQDTEIKNGTANETKQMIHWRQATGLGA